MMLDPSSPLDRSHPDNAGLRLCLLPDQAFAGGSTWLDATSQNLGSTLQNGAASGPPLWQGSRLRTASGNYVATPLTDFSSSGSIVWDTLTTGAYNDNAFCGFWGQSNGSSPYFDAQKYVDNNYYIGWNGAGGDQRVVVAATAATFPTNKPTRYAFTWISGGVSKLYCNGVLIGSNGGTTTTTNMGIQFAYGRQGGISVVYVNGSLGELRIYGMAVDANVVARDYEWWQVPDRDPRRAYIRRRFWSVSAPVTPTAFAPAFQPSFWGVA